MKQLLQPNKIPSYILTAKKNTPQKETPDITYLILVIPQWVSTISQIPDPPNWHKWTLDVLQSPGTIQRHTWKTTAHLLLLHNRQLKLQISPHMQNAQNQSIQHPSLSQKITFLTILRALLTTLSKSRQRVRAKTINPSNRIWPGCSRLAKVREDNIRRAHCNRRAALTGNIVVVSRSHDRL